MSGPRIDTYMQFTAGIILGSILFFPDINLSQSLPAFQFLDVLIPFLCLFAFLKRKSIQWWNYYTFLAVFCVYIVLTIVINGRITIVRDYFEIYKFFKFFTVILFFTLIKAEAFLKSWVKPLFAGLVLVNCIHFFDLFNFNYVLENYYDGGLNIKYFGKDTLGNPAGKRMVGLIGNPNNNALLFSFFVIYFFPFSMERNKIAWFLIALLMVFMCQSRTALIAVAAMLIVILVLKLVHWTLKQWLTFLGMVAGIFGLAWAFSSNFFKNSIYMNSLFNGVAMESQSAMGRLEAWNFLGNMIVEKPIFGYGPNKDFFYDNKIYSENEYILYTWRYGIIGLFAYLLIFWIPLKKFYFSQKTSFSRYIILISVLMLVTGLTNNPFTERNILILFGAALGMIFNLTSQLNKSAN